MAECKKFVESMSSEELCACLKERGVEDEEDLAKIRPYDGKSILDLGKEGLGKLNLSIGCSMLLEQLLDEEYADTCVENVPFTISCGSRNQYFLRVFNNASIMRILMGTEKESEASVFYMKKGKHPGEFTIRYGADQRRYLALNEERLDASLEIRRRRRSPAVLTLQFLSKLSGDKIMWGKACYIKKAHENKYLAFVRNTDFDTKCVTEVSSEDGKNDTWMKFQLHPKKYTIVKDALGAPPSTILSDVESDEDEDDTDNYRDDFDNRF